MTPRAKQQLNELYIPLLLMQARGKTVFRMFLAVLGRSFVFMYRTGLPENEMNLWAFWSENAFIPMNEQMVNLIESKRDLIDGEMPYSFQRLISHHRDYKAEYERWASKGGEYNHPSNFPAEFGEDVMSKIGQLSLESEWVPKFLT